uniref:Uncharacterized protein n=1 Tax=Solanum lycopersicum TaxID=4081 RepID=A0A3Q7JL68_SOLLC
MPPPGPPLSSTRVPISAAKNLESPPARRRRLLHASTWTTFILHYSATPVSQSLRLRRTRKAVTLFSQSLTQASGEVRGHKSPGNY